MNDCRVPGHGEAVVVREYYRSIRSFAVDARHARRLKNGHDPGVGEGLFDASVN